ncbi:hypothetical protein V6B16_09390 [Salinimicrobium catena]|uniref:hypothetical protein n=1 Tax=Salinimicrobium catena TaxID=390640 RepID=UPI002FE4EDE4
MKHIFTTLALILSLHTGYGQEKLERLDYFIGNWQGVETGVAGNGIGFRTYQYELGDNYIFVENQSTFPVSEKKPMGEVHRDKGIFSYNKNIENIVLRQFHVEGFTNIYELNTAQSNEEKLVFVTREIENNPGNWKAKLILTKDSEEHFTEEFLIAMDGINFKPFLKNTWTRVK